MKNKRGEDAMETRPFNDISYKQFLNEEKLMGAKCKKCGALYFPPRPICVSCYSSEMEWAEVKGNGKIIGFSSIFVPPAFMAEEGFDRKHPYVVGVVELEEGVRAIGRIVGVDANKPETIKIGTPVKAEFIHFRKGDTVRTHLAFRPTAGGES
jgi:uncharacterized OB-fold protein